VRGVLDVMKTQGVIKPHRDERGIDLVSGGVNLYVAVKLNVGGQGRGRGNVAVNVSS
jgi:hypothetical protein